METKPYIVRFEGANVVVNHSDCRVATEWTKDYFGLGTVKYLHSDFEGNHTFECDALKVNEQKSGCDCDYDTPQLCTHKL